MRIGGNYAMIRNLKLIFTSKMKGTRKKGAGISDIYPYPNWICSLLDCSLHIIYYSLVPKAQQHGSVVIHYCV